MRLRNVKNAKSIIESSPYTVKDITLTQRNYKSLFENDNPICLEIGMGKGDFIIGMASIYPDVNFVGIEMYESVQVRAIEKLADKDLPNLKLICCNADIINTIFDHEITTLFLNFSDPWPKKRHERRRLTSPLFLNRYETIFKGNPHIIMKTDNIGLFGYSLSSLSKHGYTLNRVSLDLENEDIDNVETEYERKFKSIGVKINYLDAVKYRDL